MMLQLLGVLATLVVIIALNRDYLRSIGWERAARMLLIWLGIIAGLGVLLRILGY